MAPRARKFRSFVAVLAVAGGLLAPTVSCSSDPAPASAATTRDATVDETTTPPNEARADVEAIDCPSGSAIESERNDTPNDANDFTELAFCGVLSTASDVDYSTFTTPAGKTLSAFQAVINGSVDFELTVNGKTFGPAETSKFEAGRYVIKAFTKESEPASYRYRIQFD